MINNNIFNIFCFLTFSFGYFLDLVFRAFFSKFGQNTGFVKYPKEKVEKQKMLKMLLLVICEVSKKISTIFKPFLAIFTLFHLKNWPYLQKPEFSNLAKTRFWFLLVNNSLCSIPLSWARSYNKETPGDRCVEAKSYGYSTNYQQNHLWRGNVGILTDWQFLEVWKEATGVFMKNVRILGILLLTQVIQIMWIEYR